ncbi:DUF4625 domain-containing protein [Muricauda ruestringensis]|jgi:hypothetical protein|uniref:DUF4625 domain-containing protein n=1 Tax=Flagellimonas marinaquae TaxID=254955 RepID=A0AA48HFX6_9FLAO|nr:MULTISPECIES: DUF4625 domain-containing protein [Allomuricauda]MCA0958345.1 DUF4625 domain-containing protein [Allomuricauda ruestringensis]USD23789.1 DUF4625 domain-containing protein [Allomuricauda aquimarina]BDW92708.1 hypothetical protein MACH07_15400 [Allomuricauda aquimarina]
MKLKFKHIFIATSIIFLSSCSSSDDSTIDEEKPAISINFSGGFPQACEVLQRGQTYTFKAQATDNVSLASYSLDIHHNFDHHTHDDQGAQCDLEAVKSAENPLIYMQNFTIAEGGTSHEINISITIPEDIDTGDYHCAYSVTDATGWQGRTSVDIKIVE